MVDSRFGEGKYKISLEHLWNQKIKKGSKNYVGMVKEHRGQLKRSSQWSNLKKKFRSKNK